MVDSSSAGFTCCDGPPPVSSNSCADRGRRCRSVGVGAALALDAVAACRMRGAPNGSSGPRCLGWGGGLYV
eukprot:2303301-Amphidinium_carterae.4